MFSIPYASKSITPAIKHGDGDGAINDGRSALPGLWKNFLFHLHLQPTLDPLLIRTSSLPNISCECAPTKRQLSAMVEVCVRKLQERVRAISRMAAKFKGRMSSGGAKELSVKLTTTVPRNIKPDRRNTFLAPF